MVVNHHKISLAGFLARLHEWALFQQRAILAQAIVCCAGYQWPDTGVFRQICQLGNITADGLMRPLGNTLQLVHRLFTGKAAIIQMDLQAVRAEIIGAPFEQGRAYRNTEGGEHSGQITMEKLVLQIAGTGGNNHLFTREQRRGQIGISLSGAGARFHHENTVISQSTRHGIAHGELCFARTEPRDMLRQPAAGSENFLALKRSRHDRGGATSKQSAILPQCSPYQVPKTVLPSFWPAAAPVVSVAETKHWKNWPGAR